MDNAPMSASQLSAPRPWRLIDETIGAHPFVSIVSAGRTSAVAYKYDPMPHEVADFQHIVDCVNACEGLSSERLNAGCIQSMIDTLGSIVRPAIAKATQ